MEKIINPCECLVYTSTGKEVLKNAFCKIKYDESKGILSITGVIAPLVSGNALGSCGQCVGEIRKGAPTKEWNKEMLNKFCDIWDEWHLNDMRPYCKHQKELGWDIVASEKVNIYHYRLTKEAQAKKGEAEKRALNCLRNGESFIPTELETYFANLKMFDDGISAEPPENYELYKSIIYNSTYDTKTLGWLRPDEHPEGILTKPCPVCGYKYGTAWLKEEVPEDVIQWLKELPETTVEPAWV